jgi:hypothetical protein
MNKPQAPRQIIFFKKIPKEKKLHFKNPKQSHCLVHLHLLPNQE